jgi:hypothetical protein
MFVHTHLRIEVDQLNQVELGGRRHVCHSDGEVTRCMMMLSFQVA